MLIIEYVPDENKVAVADGNVDRYVDDILRLGLLSGYKNFIHNGGDIELQYSTSNIFTAFRVAIKEGRISRVIIRFKFNGKLIEYDKDGRSENWPDGFLDYEHKLLERLLTRNK